MLSVMAILLAHEMGHFVQAVRHGVPASLPYFIPMPLTPIGTMGAVIGMQGSKADRRQLFDIGITGPLAGLVVALPIAWYGVATRRAVSPAPIVPPTWIASDPLLFQLARRASASRTAGRSRSSRGTRTTWRRGSACSSRG